MKKNEPYDFSVPRRQSYAAILIIMYRLYRVIIRQLIPIFIIFLIKGDVVKSQVFIYSFVAISVIAAVYSIIAFFKHFYYVENNKLIVEKGVFRKTKLEIPFDRIQSINTEQNLIHRLFKVVKLNMDTAGSAGNELQLYAVDFDVVDQLNEKILKGRKKSKSIDLMATSDSIKEEKKVIFKLSMPQLLKVGITENHLRSGLLIVFFVFYIYDSLNDVGIELMDKTDEYLPVAQEMVQSLITVLILLALFASLAFIISMIRTVLRYYNLHMYRKGGGFVIVSGLLNKKERAAKDDKIQLVTWSQNLLQKFSGIYEIVLKQASSQQVADVKSFKAVGLAKADIDKTGAYIFKDAFPELDLIPLQGVNIYYLQRRLLIWSYIFIPIIIALIFAESPAVLLYVILLYLITLLSSYLLFKKKKFGLGKSLLRIDGGAFGRASTAMSIFKVQNLSINETPFQRRRKLASLMIYSASGYLKIPEIPIEMAIEINNYLTYQVEINKKKWM